MPSTQAVHEGRLFRPVWFTSWIAVGSGALVLLPSLLPVYASVLPIWVWWTLPLQIAPLGLIALRSAYRRDGFANQWGISLATSAGTAIIFAMGAYLLLTSPFDLLEYVGMGTAGVVGLGILAWADSWSTRADESEYGKDARQAC